MAARQGGSRGGMPSRPSVAQPPRAIERGAEQKNFLFLLEEEIWRAQNKKCRENFSARQAAALRRLAAGRSKLDFFRNFR